MSMGHGLGARSMILLLVAFVALVAPRALASEQVPAAPFANSRHIDVDGVALHVRDWPAVEGAPPRCPVLLVHALAGSTYSFRHLAPALAANGHRVLAVDLPGYGYSERRPFDGSAAAALHAVLGREAPGEAWCLVGHSMGARVVGQMVAEAPRAVAAVAYLSGSPVRARRRNPAMFRAQPLRGMVLALAERRYLRADGLAEALEEGLGRPPEAAEVEAYLAPLREAGTLPAILDGYARDMGPDRSDPSTLATTPTLVLWGARDPWLKPQIGVDFVRALPGARWVQVDTAAHSPMETHPEAVLPPLLALFDAAAPRAVVATSPTAAVSPERTASSPP
jgi:pimeloyl-ACP methyl ester carboxylesterase